MDKAPATEFGQRPLHDLPGVFRLAAASGQTRVTLDMDTRNAIDLAAVLERGLRPPAVVVVERPVPDRAFDAIWHACFLALCLNAMAAPLARLLAGWVLP